MQALPRCLPIRARAALIGAALILGGLLLAGCSGTRSAAAVCQVFATDGVAFHNHYEQEAKTTNQSSALGTLADVMVAPSRIAVLMDKMDAVAPSDIEPAFKVVADTFHTAAKNQGSAALNPIGSLFSDLSLGLGSHQAFSEVDAYLADHCPRPA